MFSTAILMKPAAISARPHRLSPVLCRMSSRQRREFRHDDVGVGRHVATGAENLREAPRPQPAEHQVAVGDGERPTAAIAGRAGVRAGRSGPTRTRAPSKCRSSRRPPPPSRRASSARAPSRRPPWSRPAARTRRRNARRRSRSRPYRSRGPGRTRPRRRPPPCRRSRRPGRTGWHPCRGTPAPASPPFDFMNRAGTPASSASKLRDIGSQHRRQIGVDHVVSPRATSFISGLTAWPRRNLGGSDPPARRFGQQPLMFGETGSRASGQWPAHGIRRDHRRLPVAPPSRPPRGQARAGFSRR